MNYLKVYIKLVKNAEKRNLENGYVEKHHIFPVSIFGNNSNVVKLTYREHFIAHKLLMYIYEKRYGKNDLRTKKMETAYHKMTINKDKHYIVSSKDYELARRSIRDAKLGRKRPDMIGKKYCGADEETIKNGIEKMREKKTGYRYEYKPRPWLKGKSHPKEQSRHISESRLKTKDKYRNMSEEEFNEWINKQHLLIIIKSTGRIQPNGNVTNALNARNIPYNKYYKLEAFCDEWIHKKNHRELFYGKDNI